ncbi:MAG: DM9 repeat-containing protein [Thermodesulfobacteriota bacterium]
MFKYQSNIVLLFFLTIFTVISLDYVRAQDGKGVTWVKAVNGQIPKGAVEGGVIEGKPVYVCRAYYSNGTHPGKTWENACNIGWGGKEVAVKDFEVLVSKGSGYYPPPYKPDKPVANCGKAAGKIYELYNLIPEKKGTEIFVTDDEKRTIMDFVPQIQKSSLNCGCNEVADQAQDLYKSVESRVGWPGPTRKEVSSSISQMKGTINNCGSS